MASEIVQLLFVILGAITLVAFLVAINSKGNVKMAISYVLATCLLVVSVYEIVSYFGETKLQKQLKQQKALEEARLAKEEQEMLERQKEAMQGFKQFLQSTITQGMPLARRLRATDLADESVPIEEYFVKASTIRSKAKTLQKALNARTKYPDQYKPAREAASKAIASTITAARYLELYFKSEDEYEESKRERVFSSNAGTAISMFDQANTLLINTR